MILTGANKNNWAGGDGEQANNDSNNNSHKKMHTYIDWKHKSFVPIFFSSVCAFVWVKMFVFRLFKLAKRN